MDWLTNLFVGTGIAHSIFALCLVIGTGLFLSHILKIKGITLGITWILFCGIAFSHFGMRLDPLVESFAKDLGLILFVYSIGLQVGPSFFSSFGKQSVKMNLMAATIVLLGCATTYVIHYCSGVDIATMVGVLSGAVTNTPGLGAAEQAYADLRGASNPNIAAGYAMAYPLGVVGIILSLMAFKWIFRMSLDKEDEKVNASKKQQDEIEHIDIRLTNPQVDGIRLSELSQYCNVHFVVSRLVHPNGTDMIAEGNSVLHVGDTIRVVIDKRFKKNIMLLGEQTRLDDQLSAPRSLVSRHFVVTKPELNGKRIGDLHIRETYRISITLIPLLIVGIVSRLWLKLDYFSLMGLIAGSTTDPPALAYATSQSSQNDNAAVAYSTVYPVTMFLRVLMAQIMIMVLL